MEIEVMGIRNINDLIDKHIGFHKDMIEESRRRWLWAKLVDNKSLENEMMEDLISSSSAIAALTMLKNEVNGEVEY